MTPPCQHPHLWAQTRTDSDVVIVHCWGCEKTWTVPKPAEKA